MATRPLPVLVEWCTKNNTEYLKDGYKVEINFMTVFTQNNVLLYPHILQRTSPSSSIMICFKNILPL